MGKFKSSAVLVYGTKKIREFAAGEWDEAEFARFFFGIVKKARFFLVIRGLPGSGKSFLADFLSFGRPNMISVDPDRFLSSGFDYITDGEKIIRSIALKHELIQGLLSSESSIIVAGASSAASEIKDLLPKSLPSFVLDLFTSEQDSVSCNRHGLDAQEISERAATFEPYFEFIAKEANVDE